MNTKLIQYKIKLKIKFIRFTLKKVFYLIPLYNSESTISECLFSIGSLRHNVEVVVINDNSQDNSGITISKIKTHFICKVKSYMINYSTIFITPIYK